MTTPARIVIVMPLAEQRGGAELMLKQLTLAPCGIEWHIVFLEHGPLVDECNSPTTQTYVMEAGRLRNGHRFVRTVRQIADLTQAVGATAILGWMSKGQVYGGSAALLAGVPAYWFQLGLPADVHWLDRLATLIPAETVIVCSRAGEAIQANLWPNRSTAVAHPGTDLRRFSATSLPDRSVVRHRLGLPANAPIVVLVGRLQRWKGAHVLVEAMSQVHQYYPEAQGIIVGGKHDLEPDYPAHLDRLIRQHNLEDHVRMVGFQTNVSEWMHAADVVVHASDREPFGIVIIEAMALGRPVVATDTAGPTEIIQHQKTGLLSPYGDAASLADAILFYLNAPERASGIAKNGRRRAESFSVEKYVERVVDILQPSCPALPPERSLKAQAPPASPS